MLKARVSVGRVMGDHATELRLYDDRSRLGSKHSETTKSNQNCNSSRYVFVTVRRIQSVTNGLMLTLNLTPRPCT